LQEIVSKRRKKANPLRGVKKRSRLKKMILITLLALVCVGGAELLVCRFVDKALYDKMTNPVIEKIEIAAREVKVSKEKFWEEISAAAKEEPPEEQLAGEAAISTDLSQLDETVTKVKTRDGKEILTGGSLEITYFCQGDAAWSQQLYGSDTIGKYGCGPTVMAMAVSSLTGQNVSPNEMANWAKENGHWARKRGSYLSIVEGAAAAYGIEAEPCRSFEANRIREGLASGKLIVALMSKGHFTQGGHFILLRGATLDGGILVADPSSRDRSLLVWDVQIILDELSSSRNDDAPLWILSSASSNMIEN
jgi:hypothetical protein